MGQSRWRRSRRRGGWASDFAGRPNNQSGEFIYRGFLDRKQVAKGDDVQLRTDLSYSFENSPITAIETGFRFVNRDASYT